MAFWRIYWPVLLIMLVGGLLDGVTTLCVLRKYGPDAELHPAMRLVASILGVPLGVSLGTVVKMAFAVFTAAMFRRWCRLVLIVFGILSALGAIHNYNELL